MSIGFYNTGHLVGCTQSESHIMTRKPLNDVCLVALLVPFLFDGDGMIFHDVLKTMGKFKLLPLWIEIPLSILSIYYDYILI